MSSNNLYRNNAEDCLRMAQTAANDRPFWLTLAQSWLRLAERAARSGSETQTQKPRVGSGTR
jgi:hypothetical protein